MQLEDLRPHGTVRGVHPDGPVSVVSLQWFGSEAVELTYKKPDGQVANELLYRDDEARLEICHDQYVGLLPRALAARGARLWSIRVSRT